MYVNFLSTYSDKKSCHTSTTLQNIIAWFVSDSWASCLTSEQAKLYNDFISVECQRVPRFSYVEEWCGPGLEESEAKFLCDLEGSGLESCADNV